ncbi:MAG TPA: GTP 3',8-cyclase MoaA [Methanoculleus sp.]|nr:GTP 3',8-cyclase MoaA [Methanoculleus sp.]
MLLEDTFGRKVTNLRISLTPRCNLRCFYCHSEGECNPDDEMSLEEIDQILKTARHFDMKSVKLTGGEPLMRKDLCEIVSLVPEEMESSLTTNGTLLAGTAEALKEAGLSRVNISLDSLQRERYQEIAGRDLLPQVLRGIDAALEYGLTPVKLNVVILGGVNDDEINDFIDFAKGRDHLILQFIELMEDFRNCPYHMDLRPMEEELSRTSKTIITRRMHHRKKYCVDGAEIEIVRPQHNTEFCAHCNRLRVTSDGKLKPCLLRNDNHVDVRGKNEDEMRELFKEAVLRRRPFYS